MTVHITHPFVFWSFISLFFLGFAIWCVTSWAVIKYGRRKVDVAVQKFVKDFFTSREVKMLRKLES